MMRAVFDTNVIVSGVLSPNGPPGRLLEGILGGEVVAVVDDRLLGEYRQVLRRPRLCLPPMAVELLLNLIAASAEHITVPVALRMANLPDPTDSPFAECARAADVPLVTGNLRHFPKVAMGTVRVLSPRAFLDALCLEVEPR